jgi:Protein of unknown function (DUF1573)
MRILTVMIVSALTGTLVGAALAYVGVINDGEVAEIASQDLQSATLITTGDAPRVQIDEPHYHFGTMERGRTRSHRFEVKNVGNAPLRLQVGQTSCKCTLGEVTGDAIPPGGSTHVELEWSAKAESGPFRQTAIINTNDPVQSRVELSIEGEVVAATGVQPPEIVFDKVTAGESKSVEVYVMALVQDEIEVSQAELSDDATREKFDVKIERVERELLPNPNAKDGVKITLTVKGELPIGRFDQWLSLRTNLQDGEKVEIPVIGRVVGDIGVYGVTWSEEQGALALGKVKSSQGARAKLNVVVRGAGANDVKFNVESVDPTELKVTFGEPKRLSDVLTHVPVEIEVPAGTRPMVRLPTAQSEPGRVVLSTTHPKVKELVLGVRFAVER